MIRALSMLAFALFIGTGAAQAACDLPANASQLTAQAARLMNAERARHGLAPLSPETGLARAAGRQACDMAVNGVRSHTGSDGSTFARRYRAEGCRGAGGENLAWGQRSPDSAIEWWMNSPGHRATILHARARSYGIAVTMSGARPNWVMVVGGSC